MLTLHEFYNRYERGGRRRPSLWQAFLRGFGAMYAIGPRDYELPRYPRDALYTDLVRIGVRATMGYWDRDVESGESRAP